MKISKPIKINKAKYARRKPTVAKAVKKAADRTFTKKVLKVLHRKAENKTWVAYAANQAIVTAAGTFPSRINLLPAIAQGVEQNKRIGNQVNVMKAEIRGYINILPYNATTNPTVGPVYVKMWLLSCKDIKNSADLSTSTINTNFFQVGTLATAFQGNILDLCLVPNKELVTVYQTKTVLLSAGSTQGSTYYNAAGASCGGEGKFSVPFYFSYGKHCKVLKYDDASPTQPTNRNLWLIYQCVYADGTTSAVNSAEIHYVYKVEYEDM